MYGRTILSEGQKEGFVQNTNIHAYKHFRRAGFSEVDFSVNLDGNVLVTVNLSSRDRDRGVMKSIVNVTSNSRWHI